MELENARIVMINFPAGRQEVCETIYKCQVVSYFRPSVI